MFKQCTLIVVVSSLFLAGCGRTYQRRLLGSPDIHGYNVDVMEGESQKLLLKIGVFPEEVFATSSRTYLPVTFGFLPFRIVISNESNQGYRLNMEDVFLSTNSGGEYQIMSSQEVVNRLKISQGNSIAGYLLFVPLGIAESVSIAKHNRRTEDAIGRIESEYIDIEPFMKKEGYVFFNVNRRLASLRDHNILLKIRNIENGDVIDFRVFLGGKAPRTEAKLLRKNPVHENGMSVSGGMGKKTVKEKLLEIKELFSEGFISEEEYDLKRKAWIEKY